MQDAAAMSLFRSATPQPTHSVPGRIDTPPIIVSSGEKEGVGESPYLVTSNRNTIKSTAAAAAVGEGHKSPIRAPFGGGDGPPLLAPIATLPSLQHEKQASGEGEGEDADTRLTRSMNTISIDPLKGEARGGRRDSSPSTPRPAADDRETF